MNDEWMVYSSSKSLLHVSFLLHGFRVNHDVGGLSAGHGGTRTGTLGGPWAPPRGCETSGCSGASRVQPEGMLTKFIFLSNLLVVKSNS